MSGATRGRGSAETGAGRPNPSGLGLHWRGPGRRAHLRISLAFTGMGPIAPTLPAVRAAEQNGLDGVWHAEHFGYHDAFVPAALSLAQTANIEVSLVGLSGAGRHPAVTAMELASLAEIAPGRMRAAVGTGDPGLVATLGAPRDTPLARTEALVRSLRAALTQRTSGRRTGTRKRPDDFSVAGRCGRNAWKEKRGRSRSTSSTSGDAGSGRKREKPGRWTPVIEQPATPIYGPTPPLIVRAC